MSRSGNDYPIAVPYGLFQTADEPTAIAPNNDEFFGRLMDALDLPELKADPRLASNPLRVAERARLNAAVEARLASAGAAHWVAVLNKAGVPCGLVHRVDAVFADPQVQSQRMALDVPHPEPRRRADAGLPHALSRRAAAGAPSRARPRSTHRRNPDRTTGGS